MLRCHRPQAYFRDLLDIMDMNDKDDDWILISPANPKKRCAPKPVPVAPVRYASSLDQPLKKGGKPAPTFVRPVSVTTPADPPPRQPGPELQFEGNSRSQSVRQKTSTGHAISAPRGVKTVQIGRASCRERV